MKRSAEVVLSVSLGKAGALAITSAEVGGRGGGGRPGTRLRSQRLLHLRCGRPAPRGRLPGG